MSVEQVFPHRHVCPRLRQAGQTADVVTQFLDGVVAVDKKVLLEEVTQLKRQKFYFKKNHQVIYTKIQKLVPYLD